MVHLVSFFCYSGSVISVSSRWFARWLPPGWFRHTARLLIQASCVQNTKLAMLHNHVFFLVFFNCMAIWMTWKLPWAAVTPVLIPIPSVWPVPDPARLWSNSSQIWLTCWSVITHGRVTLTWYASSNCTTWSTSSAVTTQRLFLGLLKRSPHIQVDFTVEMISTSSVLDWWVPLGLAREELLFAIELAV